MKGATVTTPPPAELAPPCPDNCAAHPDYPHEHDGTCSACGRCVCCAPPCFPNGAPPPEA